MPKPERYFIGPNVRTKLQQLFDSTPGLTGGGGETIPTRLQNMQRPGAAMRLCKTTAAFNKGTVATLNVWEGGTPPNETQSAGVTVTQVVNKYADIATGKFVSVATHGNGRWYVIAAECETPAP